MRSRTHAGRTLAVALVVLATALGVTSATGQVPPPPPPTGPEPPPGLVPPQLPGDDTNGPVIGLTQPRQFNGAVRWSVRCPQTEQRCRGTVRITTLRPVAGAGAAKSRRLVLSVKRYQIRGGKSKKVAATLNRRGRNLVLRRKKVPVKATFTTRDKAGNVKRRTQVFNLHAGILRHN